MLRKGSHLALVQFTLSLLKGVELLALSLPPCSPPVFVTPLGKQPPFCPQKTHSALLVQLLFQDVRRCNRVSSLKWGSFKFILGTALKRVVESRMKDISDIKILWIHQIKNFRLHYFWIMNCFKNWRYAKIICHFITLKNHYFPYVSH